MLTNGYSKRMLILILFKLSLLFFDMGMLFELSNISVLCMKHLSFVALSKLWWAVPCVFITRAVMIIYPERLRWKTILFIKLIGATSILKREVNSREFWCDWLLKLILESYYVWKFNRNRETFITAAWWLEKTWRSKFGFEFRNLTILLNWDWSTKLLNNHLRYSKPKSYSILIDIVLQI